MPSDELIYMPAHEALRRFRDRSLSPVEMTNAVLARIDATEPQINALPLVFPEQARAAASASEARYMGRGTPPKPLDGLCVAIKDSTDFAGQPTSLGSLLSSEQPVASSSITNDRLNAAGGIAHARSATPEFSCSSTTWSRKWGVTRNPWDLARTPGGSSGGASAALAAGSTALAIGSDIAGSIRIPAACCGVVGYKPPRGRVPQDPPVSFDPYCHVGPMGRCVGDVALLQNILAGPHPHDPYSGLTEPPTLVPHAMRDLAGLRIAYSSDLGGFPLDPQVRADFERTLALFESEGAELSEVALDWGPEVIDAALGHLQGNFGAWIAETADGREDLLTSYTHHFAHQARTLPAGSAMRAMEIAARMGAQFGAIMARHDLFLCPTLACPPVSATHDPSKDEIMIDGVAVDPLIGWVLTVPFNMLSMYPVLSLPSGCGISQSFQGVSLNMPLGVQMVGHPHQEAALFEVAQAYENVRGPWFVDKGPRPNISHLPIPPEQTTGPMPV